MLIIFVGRKKKELANVREKMKLAQERHNAARKRVFRALFVISDLRNSVAHVFKKNGAFFFKVTHIIDQNRVLKHKYGVRSTNMELGRF